MPTDNPIPSSDPSDLLFNAPRFDEFMNGEGDHFSDRKGQQRRTLSSLERDFPSAQDNMQRALEYAEHADSARDVATSAADAAVLARDASIAAAGPLYATEAAGRAAVADGETFNVQGSGDIAAYQYRRVNSTTSTLLSTFPSAESVKNLAQRKLVQAFPVPLAAAGGRAWCMAYADGLDFYAVSQQLAVKTFAKMGSPIKSAVANSARVPLWTAAGRAVAWAEQDGICYYAVSQKLCDMIGVKLPQSVRPFPKSATAPLATDGRTLFRWRARKTLFSRGTAGARLKVGLAGDSWHDFTSVGGVTGDAYVPGAYMRLLKAAYGVSGYGYIPPTNAGYRLPVDLGSGVRTPGVALSAEWTTLNAADAVDFPYACGLGGFSTYTTSDAATRTVSNIQCTRYEIGYFNYGGTFRYSVDGGAPVVVTCANDGSYSFVAIDGLEDAVHTIAIDTVGNTGVVSLAGDYASRPGVRGAELIKFARAGTTGFDLQKYVGWMAPQLARLDLDVIVVKLGTNDFRSTESPPAVYIAALRAFAAAVKSVLPDCGLIFSIPAQTSGAVVPLSTYRDALYQMCIEDGHEFHNQHDAWGTRTQMAAFDFWADSIHMNDNGSECDVANVNELFLKIGE